MGATSQGTSRAAPRANGDGTQGTPARARGGGPLRARAGTTGSVREWAALWTVYLVWGSTFLGIAILVETVPPLLGAGARFLLAGIVLLAGIAAWRGGFDAIRVPRRTLLPSLLVGVLLPGANAVITVGERDVPSNLAALLAATIPLWLVLMRAATRARPRGRELAGVVVGFAGVALLLAPGRQTGAAGALGLAGVLVASLMWASGSFASSRLPLPRDALVATGYQMLLGGTVIGVAGLVAGEAGGLDPGAFSPRSGLAFAYLVGFGSIVAYTAYAWLLRNAPLARTATYAYVNPLVAIVLGHLVLAEAVTALTGAGAGLIVLAVALVVRTGGAGPRPRARRARPRGARRRPATSATSR